MQNQGRKSQGADIKALLTSKDCRDLSLANYRRSLIPEENLLFENSEPEIQVKSMKIYDDGTLVHNSDVSKDVNLVLGEDKLYDVEIHFHLKKAIVYGLTIVNSIYKSIIRLSKQEYRQGTFGPLPSLQTARFSIKTPSGYLGRGSYNGQSSIKDKNSKTYFELKYKVEIVSNQ